MVIEEGMACDLVVIEGAGARSREGARSAALAAPSGEPPVGGHASDHVYFPFWGEACLCFVRTVAI